MNATARVRTHHNHKQAKGSQEYMVNDHHRILQTKLDKIDVTIGNISQTRRKNLSIALDDVTQIRKDRFSWVGAVGFAIVIVSIVRFSRISIVHWRRISRRTAQQYFVVYLAHMHPIHVPQIVNEVGGSEPCISIGHKMRCGQKRDATRRITHNRTSR